MNRQRARTEPAPTASGPWRFIAIAGAVIIAYFTLFPFDFHVPPDRTIGSTLADFDIGLSAFYLADVPWNVLLFAPFGFGLAGMLRSRRPGMALAAVLGGGALIGAALSTMLEFVQGFALLRAPSVADIAANALGSTIGALLFVLAGPRLIAWARRAVRAIDRRITVRRLAVFGVLYLAAVTAVMIWSPSATALSGWDRTFPLIIGNEETGDRPWSGTMLSASVLDRSLTDDEVDAWRVRGATALDDGELVVHQDFTDDGPGVPRLEWAGAVPERDTVGVSLDADHWLRSVRPATAVTSALARTSEFTVLIEAATTDLDQGGPARLLSVSGGVLDRNLTVGQEQTDLVLRMRTPLLGRNGTDPALVVPDVFTDTEVHDIVVRFDGSTVRVGVDSATTDHSIELAPEVVVLISTFPYEIEEMRTTDVQAAMFYLLMRMIVFVPASAALVWVWRRHRDRRTGVAVGAIVIALPAVLELVLAATIEPYRFRVGLAALGSAVLAAGLAAGFAVEWSRRRSRQVHRLGP